MALGKTSSAAIGGVLGGTLVLGVGILLYKSRIESLTQTVAEKAGKDFMKNNYGLTDERIAKIEEYAKTFG